MISHGISPIGRRNLLGLAVTALAAAIPLRLAGAQTTDDASTTAAIEQLDNALLAAMKAGGSTPFDDRYRALAPVIDRVFDLDAVLAASIGLSWATLPADQKAALATAFRRYTVSSYTTSFNSYNGQSFQVSPTVRALGNGQVVVNSRLRRADGSSVGTRLRDAPRTGGLAGGGRTDGWLDQPRCCAALGLSWAAERRWYARTGGRPRAQGSQPLRRRHGMSSPSLLQRALVGLVDASRRHAWTVVLVGLLLAAGSGLYASRHLGVNTNTDQMFSASLPWRQRAMALDRAFPQFQDLLVAVIDANVPEEAEETARDLTRALAADHTNFSMVSRPGSSPYLSKEGLLFLATPELTNLMNRTIDAQPFLGTLSADPTSRGLFSALGLLGQGVTHGDADLAPYADELRAFHTAMAAAIAGHPQPLSWQQMLSSGLGDLGGEVSIRTCQAAARLPLAPTGRGGNRGNPRDRGDAALRAERRGTCAHHRPGGARRHAVRNGRRGDRHRAYRQRGPDRAVARSRGWQLGG